MKQIIFAICFIYFVACYTTEEELKLGPAHNVGDRGSYSCEDFYVYQGGEWNDDKALGVSDCVDLNLYSVNKSKYYDKCCYVRFQLNGQMHQGCVGLNQEQFSDTTETIYKMENGDRLIWTSAARNSKIYQLDCNASYLKFISLAVALIGLLL